MAATISQTPLVFHDQDSFEVFCRIPSTDKRFSRDYLGVTCLWEEGHRGQASFLSHDPMGPFQQHDVSWLTWTLIIWLKPYLSGSSVPHLPKLGFLGEVWGHPEEPHLWEGGSNLNHLEPSTWDTCFLSIVYSIIIRVWTRVFLFTYV